MSSINTDSKSSIINQLEDSFNLGPTSSIQLEFAKLQLALSTMSKEAALEQMELIEQAQDEQAKVSAMLQEARQLQADAKASGKCTRMPSEMEDYMDQNGLAYDKKGNDSIHHDDEWDIAIQSLQSQLDQIGTNTQQIMVLINDYMGQYNSYLQGANTSITQSNQVLQTLARG